MQCVCIMNPPPTRLDVCVGAHVHPRMTMNETNRDVNVKSMLQINRRTPVAAFFSALSGQDVPLGQVRANTHAALLNVFAHPPALVRTKGHRARTRKHKTRSLHLRKKKKQGACNLAASVLTQRETMTKKKTNKHARAHSHTACITQRLLLKRKKKKEHSQVPLSNSHRAASIKIKPRYPAWGLPLIRSKA